MSTPVAVVETRLRAKKAVPLNARTEESDAIRMNDSTTRLDSSRLTPASDVPKCPAAQIAAFNSKMSSSLSTEQLAIIYRIVTNKASEHNTFK